jgi:2-keto-4-pentenoate hydratase/2-oxohepta-3-ene-1,7-dioic acid hydratase in catechol pathway
MRLATIRQLDGKTTAAVQDNDHWVLLNVSSVSELIHQSDWQEIVESAIASSTAHREDVATATLVAPLPSPQKIVCCGLNYHDHIVETGRDVPEYPTLFAKFADTIVDPYSDIEVGSDSAKVDWEAELAVIVGAPLRKATRAEAEAAIFGYTVANDVSYRDWQSRTLQWFQGKAWDATMPVGPVIVTADEISPKQGLEIVADIDGEVMQRSNTRELVFDSADLVAYVSQFTQLRPGDLILTGTPGGVGLGQNPQRWLRDGETLTTTIEGIGSLRNTFRMSSGKVA